MNAIDWQPTATIEALRRRAEIISVIRQFFTKRNVLEVETPSLSSATVTDPHLYSIVASLSELNQKAYLQTSPEFFMKRLLAAGSGSIYQICKAFRDGEKGGSHNPEFTILEWYRIDYDHHQLMDEMDELLRLVLNCERAERYTYQAIFEKQLKINPHTASIDELRHLIKEEKIEGIDYGDRDLLLQLLMTYRIEPSFERTHPTFIYDYPKSQAMLSRINHNVGERFEVYFGAIELANGFHELSDANEQRQRFEQDQLRRKQLGFNVTPMDERFLAALENGLPDCAGVALGIDRLMMIALKQKSIADVMSFAFERS